MHNVYKINSTYYYFGVSFVAADNVDEANAFIDSFKKSDPENIFDSRGYENVTEDDVVDNLYSDIKGIVYKGICYTG